jgi:exportin-7
MLNTLTCALSGNYVNFGVFSLYQDKALQNSFDVALQVCLQIPLSDVLAYVKLSKAYFALLEVLFRNHLDVLCILDAPVFIQLVKTNLEGLQSSGEQHYVIDLNDIMFLLFCTVYDAELYSVLCSTTLSSNLTRRVELYCRFV